MRLRLFLSFALITVITLTVLGVMIQGNTQTTLTSFAKSGAFFGADRMINQLQAYYVENGSWNGVEQLFSSSALQTSPGSISGQSGNSPGQGMGANQGMGSTRGGNMFMGGQGMMGSFSLVDSEGYVLVSDDLTLAEIIPQDVLQNSIPITVDSQVVGYIIPENSILDLSDVIRENLSNSLTESLVPTVLITGGAALILALIFAQFLMRPVRQLTNAAKHLAEGDLTQRVPTQGGKELSQLGRAFNQMAKSLESSQHTRKAMTADIAHELRTPLAVQRANLEAIQDGVYPLTLENLEPVIQQNILLNKLVEDLRTLALSDTNALTLDKTPTDLVPFISRICESVQPQFDAGKIDLQFTYPEDYLQATIDPARINQVIYNLLQNALRHTPSGGQVSLELSCDNQNVTLSLKDSGEGIPEESLPLIFERFYRADQSRARDKGGTGLGLTIALRLVEAHQGTITAANHPDGGAVFTISLPLE